MDSPFSKLTELMLELVEEQKIPIPRSLMRVALSMMRRSVKKRAGFNIDEVAPIDQIQSSFIPVLFGEQQTLYQALMKARGNCSKYMTRAPFMQDGDLHSLQGCTWSQMGLLTISA